MHSELPIQSRLLVGSQLLSLHGGPWSPQYLVYPRIAVKIGGKCVIKEKDCLVRLHALSILKNANVKKSGEKQRGVEGEVEDGGRSKVDQGKVTFKVS